MRVKRQVDGHVLIVVDNGAGEYVLCGNVGAVRVRSVRHGQALRAEELDEHAFNPVLEPEGRAGFRADDFERTDQKIAVLDALGALDGGGGALQLSAEDAPVSVASSSSAACSIACSIGADDASVHCNVARK